ncbi:hypothetical protein JW905_13635 [bacterium]|nr:hypothetical protein [candidate division CSSED10-310 bacterium]
MQETIVVKQSIESFRPAGLNPFCGDDLTAGCENEFQTVVQGRHTDVDLPLIIQHSNYYANIMKRTARGDTPAHIVTNLTRYLDHNPGGVWENSWVRFPLCTLSSFARNIWQEDSRADKSNPLSPARADIAHFLFEEQGTTYLRVPVSYLLKLALADAVGSQERIPWLLQAGATQALSCFSNDNTSPEIVSFHLSAGTAASGPGRSLSYETARRFLLVQLLVAYANRRFGLVESGQRAMIYSSPLPPLRQQQLNSCISDAFYRELFMSPCLSGWDHGEDKRRYMGLCHEVMSRSHLNTLAKLKEAGIISRNLVMMPTTSNTSLSNNGTHVSLGSIALGELLEARNSGFGPVHEKYYGDLAIKLFEHFIPLFINTYAASPRRIDFHEFHPEQVLGFLPHELDYTHLRMLWRRWRRKAHNSILGKTLTPSGLPYLDRLAARILCLAGDLVPDYRLLDYLVALLGTEQSPALNGVMGNGDRLQRDLWELGVFHPGLSLYLLYKLRTKAGAGFTGFEGRYYSLFHSLLGDMGAAVDLQALITAMVYRFALQGRYSHGDIPDEPALESERRQGIFFRAIDLPTFFVRSATRNRFLQDLLPGIRKTRSSRRYAGFTRIPILEYCMALVRMLRCEAADLIDEMGMENTMRDLEARIGDPVNSVASILIADITGKAGSGTPLKLDGKTFNAAAEAYFRDDLRFRHIQEGLQVLAEDLRHIQPKNDEQDPCRREAIHYILGNGDMASMLEDTQAHDLEALPQDRLLRLINLVLLVITLETKNLKNHVQRVRNLWESTNTSSVTAVKS